MIDDSDVDSVFLVALFSNGWTAGIAIIIGLIMMFIVSENKDECSKKQCPVASQQSQLLNHQCLCVQEAK